MKNDDSTFTPEQIDAMYVKELMLYISAVKNGTYIWKRDKDEDKAKDEDC